jgi:FkbM family methyltransferase
LSPRAGLMASSESSMNRQCNFLSVASHTLVPNFLPAQATVVDVGANVGEFSTAMAREFGCRCIAIEPSPRVFEQIPAGERLRRFNLAIAGSAGEVELHIGAESHATSMHRVHVVDYLESIRVPARTLEDFCTTANIGHIDLLKMDIEGEELGVFRSCSDDFLRGIGQITVEFHEWAGVGTKADVRQVIGRLQRLGFFTFSFARTEYLDVLFVNGRDLSRLGYAIAWANLWVPRFFRSLLRRAGLLFPASRGGAAGSR